MGNPGEENVPAIVDETEQAIAEFSALYEAGELGSLDFDDATELIDTASRSTVIAANAFGEEPDLEHDSPELLRERLTDAFTREYIIADIESLQAEREAELARRNQAHRDSVIYGLGVSDDDLARLDFDAENGDTSPWLALEAKYMFE